MQWTTVQKSTPYSEWPTTFAEASAPPGMAPMGGFFFFSGQFQRKSPGPFGIDILLDGNVLGTAWSSVDDAEGYQLVNEVLVPLPPLPQSYEIGLQPHQGAPVSGQLTPECRMSGTLVKLYGPPVSGQIQTANAASSNYAPHEVCVPIPPAGAAIDAFMLLSGQVNRIVSGPGETILQVQGAGANGTSHDYASIAGQTSMAPFLLAAEQLPADGKYGALFSVGVTATVDLNTSYQTASVVELEQPDR